MKNFPLTKALPYIVAVVLFTVLAFIYFSPVIEGKVVMGHDSQTYAGVSKEASTYKENTGQPQYWTNSLFGGMPTYQISGDSGQTLPKYIHAVLSVFPRPASFLFLYLLCGFLLLLSFRVNPWLSIVGSLAFAFASYNFIIIAAGHSSKALAIAYAMPLVGSVALAYRGQHWRWIGGLLTILSLGLAIYVNHLQILYYTLLTLGLYFAVELVFAIKEKKLSDFFKTTGILVVAAIIGIALNAATLMSTYEYSKYTMRGPSNGLTVDENSVQDGLNIDYITEWSYGIDETLTLLIPDYKGGASYGKVAPDSETAKRFGGNVETQLFPLYWGTQQFTSGPVYVGAIVCFLFVLGLFIVKGRYKWWLLAVTVLSILLAWGRNFMPFTEFFVNYMPMYKSFRAVSMTLVMAGISMPLLGILALKTLFEASKEDKKKILNALYYSTAIVGGICLLFWLIPSIAGSFVSAADAQFSGQAEFLKATLPLDRKAMLSGDALRSLSFILLTAAVLYFVLRDKLKTGYAVGALALLLVLDLWPVAKRYLNDDNFVDGRQSVQVFRPTAADNFILQDKSPDYRVLNMSVNIFNDASTSYFHKSIGGYHGAKLRRYQELVNILLQKEIAGFGAALQTITALDELNNQLAKLPILNMLNTKYIILNPDMMPLTNPYANGNAWFVNNVSVVNDANEEMTTLGQIDTKTTAVVDKSFEEFVPQTIVPDSAASIVMLSYEPMMLKYHFKSTTDQLAVFSEIYYDKGWNAYINGEKVPYIRANYLLRAMPLKAGNYDIEFRFEPTVVSVGHAVVIIAGILTILLIGLFVFFRMKKKAANDEK